MKGKISNEMNDKLIIMMMMMIMKEES